MTVIEYLEALRPAATSLPSSIATPAWRRSRACACTGTDAEERGLPDADDATVLGAMAAEPILIERPLVETDKGVRLCRPQEKVQRNPLTIADDTACNRAGYICERSTTHEPLAN